MEELENDGALPVWPVFADVLACLGGLVVLLFVWAVISQIDLSEQLFAERVRVKTEQEAIALDNARVAALEKALAAPIADGRITMDGPRVGIRGSVLFPLMSTEMSDEGQALVRDLAGPLASYVAEADTVLMVSGFTDDLAIHDGARYLDNWELSAQRALTVTRLLITSGFPADRAVAVGFGEHHPIADNSSELGRAQNRRVEIAPVPRPAARGAPKGSAPGRSL
ncbi:MAG: OmpA family protein [Myxococcota bacterium]